MLFEAKETEELSSWFWIFSERVQKASQIVTPANAGVQEKVEKPGFPLPRE